MEDPYDPYTSSPSPNNDGTGWKMLTADCDCVMFNGSIEWSVDNMIQFQMPGEGVCLRRDARSDVNSESRPGVRSFSA